MAATLTVVILVLLWGLVLVRLPTVFRDAKQRALWSTYLSLALVKLTALDSVQARLSRLDASAQLLPHLLSVGCALFLVRFLSLVTDYYASRPRAARLQVIAAVAVGLVLVGLYAAAPHGIQIDGPDLLTVRLPASVVAYWVVLDAYLGGVLVAGTAVFWSTSREAPPGALRAGLRCIAAGLLLIAVFAAQRIVFVLAHAAGFDLPSTGADPIFQGLRAIGVILAVAGAVVPAIGWVRSVVQTARSLRALRPLWWKMQLAFPDIILFSARRAVVERLGVDDVHLRLYRRVIEIRDGLLALRGYLPEATGAAAFLGDRDGRPPPAALVEACAIELALRRHQLGLGPVEQPGRWAPVGAELVDEVSWLRAVTEALGRAEPAMFAAAWTQRQSTVDKSRSVTGGSGSPAPTPGGPFR